MTSGQQARTNRLAGETSPYLLQHATNPVDWYPWGDEAFARARREDKPLLVSIGYSSCHWCHVMAHESFEDEHVAALMNEYFVNVKVDREERPDVDAVYMLALQSLTGQGGWPMTVFTTPDRKPFYAGTYFPPEDAPGRPSFQHVLEAVRVGWMNERTRLLESADAITAHLERAANHGTPPGGFQLTPELPRLAVSELRQTFDATWGGFSGEPKFPPPASLEFLLAHHVRAGAQDSAEPGALDMVLRTLDRMATGGMYDQLAGGFSRYSVDRFWMVPHFEKMLYDNAQLARVYLHAYQLTGDARHERVARETLDYLLREMRDPEGGFYSSQDADSEGLEGKYYVWTVDEVREALGDQADFFCAVFGVTREGNFHDPHHPELIGRNVLSRRSGLEEVAARFGLSPEDAAAKVESLRTALLTVRQERVPPGLDDKVLASWNGMVLAALAGAARVFDDATYRAAAEQNAAFARRKLWQAGQLLHTYRAGRAHVDGLLEDYACYGLGLVELYKLTGDLAHLEWAREMFEIVLERFRDQARGGFFETPANGERLILRQKQFFDAATPSGNAAAALLAAWLGRYYGRPEWERLALEVVSQVQDYLLAAPAGLGTLWQVIEFLLAPPRELVIIGDPAERASLEREAASRYSPWLLVAPSSEGQGLELFEGRARDGRAVAYVCENMVCKLPAHSPEELRSQMASVAGAGLV
jgi:uncharacterized protein YyaL (SSP411 family)